MSETVDTFDQIARSGEAVFAIDGSDRIVYWSDRCQEIFGRTAEDVLGMSCWSVIRGRDLHGNIHCYRNCPVMFQGRNTASDPPRGFALAVECAGGNRKHISVGTIMMGEDDASLSTIVHVVRENCGKPTPLELTLREHAAAMTIGNPILEISRSVADLTEREQEVLYLLARGWSTARLAEELGISPVTVRNHVQKVLEKLNVHTKMAAVAYAYRQGLVTVESAEEAG